ncbi:MAG: ComEC/Rec2 family competence protein, partial [Candidatus Aminicenantes bacterium]|nr:ComEC/Rec2 family competence protein [Candidatus Aminicenantes bacterium]
MYISLAFILGIFGASLIPLPPLLLLPILAFSHLLAWIIFLKKKEMPALVLSLITIFLAGAALYQNHNTGYEKNALHRFNPDIYADFTGILFRTPSRGLDKDTLYLKVENIIFGTNEKQIKGNLKISLFHTPELVHIRNLLTGDRIKVSAQISTFPGFRNFNSAPSEWLLKTQNLHNRAHSKSPLLVQKIRPGSHFSPLRGISLIRRGLQEKIQELFPGSNTHSISEKGAVLEALLLGERGRIPETTIQALQKAGLFHLFAISGAHIGIISFILFSLLKILK